MLFYLYRSIDIEKVIFSNKKYQDQIKIKSFLQTEEELKDTLDRDVQNIKQKTYRDLGEKVVYLVTFVKNDGEVGAWGTLRNSVYGRNIDIEIPILTPNMDFYNLYIISLRDFIWPMEDVTPDIKTDWIELYTK